MKEIIFAGFGGQGVLTGGLVLAEMSAAQGRNTVWMPAYGPTMRGGKANCVVKYGDTTEEKIGSPIMEEADILVAMNEPSLDYIEFCRPGAAIVVNSFSVPADYAYPKGMKVVSVNCVELADKVGNPKGQSLVMVGAVIKALGLFEYDFAKDALLKYFAGKGKGKFAAANEAAFNAGFEAAQMVTA
jgi:2-oxoglutarate ferredoxin oxidoreductase subunit gamma